MKKKGDYTPKQQHEIFQAQLRAIGRTRPKNFCPLCNMSIFPGERKTPDGKKHESCVKKLSFKPEVNAPEAEATLST